MEMKCSFEYGFSSSFKESIPLKKARLSGFSSSAAFPPSYKVSCNDYNMF